MNYPKGYFDTITLRSKHQQFEMKGWLEPSIVNTGDANLIVHGQIIEPGDRLQIGPANVLMEGTVRIQWGDGQNKQARVNYVQIDSP